MDWNNPLERKEIANLRKRGLEWGEIARRVNAKFHMNRTADACSSLYRRMKNAGELVELAEDFQGAGPSYDELIEEWHTWIGYTAQEVRFPTSQSDKRRLVSILSDSHCPFVNMNLVAQWVARGPYDLTIMAGDLLDYNSCSTFIKREHVDIDEEIKSGTALLTILAENSVEVKVLLDNHSRRIIKALSKCSDLPVRLMELLGWLTPEINVLDIMTAGLDNVHVARMEVNPLDGTDVCIRYMIQEGDLIVAHPDMSRKHDLTTPRGFEEDFLRPWSHHLGLSPWRVLALAHTHGAAIGWREGGGKMHLELGAAVTLAGVRYAIEEGKVKYRPFVPVFTVLEQVKGDDDWETDFNSVRQVVVN